MISDFFTTPFSVMRQVWVEELVLGETIDSTEEQEVATFNGYRQQASAEDVQSLGLTMTKPHKIWCAIGTDVNEGDMLESDFGVDAVRAKQINRDGDNAHIELMVEYLGDIPESES